MKDWGHNVVKVQSSYRQSTGYDQTRKTAYF